MILNFDQASSAEELIVTASLLLEFLRDKGSLQRYIEYACENKKRNDSYLCS